MHPALPVRALLFDLGNVLVEIDFARVLAAWAPHSRLPADELRARFSMDEPYRRHERGLLDAGGYFAHLRELLQLDCDADVLQAGWNAVFVRPIDATLQRIDQMRDALPCYVFSNTNAVHLAAVEHAWPDLLGRFTHVFASHAIGLRKPERAAFEHVVAAMGVAAEEVLFFDDVQENVEGAAACGLQAVLVRGPDDVARALQPLIAARSSRP